MSGATRKPQVRWRNGYGVWLQAQGRDRDDREFAAACYLCRPSEGSAHDRGGAVWSGAGELWLCQRAGSRKEAWEIARRHHERFHIGGVR